MSFNLCRLFNDVFNNDDTDVFNDVFSDVLNDVFNNDDTDVSMIYDEKETSNFAFSRSDHDHLPCMVRSCFNKVLPCFVFWFTFCFAIEENTWNRKTAADNDLSIVEMGPDRRSFYFWFITSLGTNFKWSDCVRFERLHFT